MDRPWEVVRGDLDREVGRRLPAIVGYGRGRPLLDEAVERQLRSEDALRHRRVVERIDYTPAEHFAVATLTCGHTVRLTTPGPPLRHVGKLLPCPECAA